VTVRTTPSIYYTETGTPEIVAIICSAVTAYFVSPSENSDPKLTTFEQKELCAEYQDEMQEQINNFHGEEVNTELREVFFSSVEESCLYYYAYSYSIDITSYQILYVKDYFSNKLIHESKPMGFYDQESESNFELKIENLR